MDNRPKPLGPLPLEILKYLLFHIFRLIWNVFIGIWWQLTGVASLWKSGQDPSNYERCAQVLVIRGKLSFSKLISPNSASQFLVTHDRFTHPNYVLKPEVSLYTVENDEALFIEAPPGVQAWKLEYGAFHRCAQFQTGIRLIRMPIYEFHCLATEVGDPNGQLIFLDFLPRSGSTLMCQMFEATGRCVTFSEPDMFTKAHQPDSVGPQQAFEKEVVSSIRLFCKSGTMPVPPLTYLFKIGSNDFSFQHIYPILKERYPESKLLYIYRNTTEAVSSHIKAYPLDNTIRVMMSIETFSVKLLAWIGAKVFQNLDQNKELLKVMKNTSDPVLVQTHVLHVKSIAFFMKQCNSELRRPAIKYEHLLANPEECLRKIFKYCGLPEDLVPLAQRAMDYDSQANSPICRAYMHGLAMHKEPTDEVVKDIEAIEQILGVSTFRKNLLLPNTITVPS